METHALLKHICLFLIALDTILKPLQPHQAVSLALLADSLKSRIASEPDFAPYHMRLAEVCLQVGQWKEASSAALAALRLTDLEPYNELLLRRAAKGLHAPENDPRARARAEERHLGLRLSRFGFTKSSLAALQATAADSDSLWLQAHACRQLALYFYRQRTSDSYTSAIHWAKKGAEVALLREHRDACRILQSLALLDSGRSDEAKACLHGFKDSGLYTSDLLLCLSNTEAALEAKVRLINRALARHALSAVRFADAGSNDFLYDRLRGVELPQTTIASDSPLITVIVAAFNSSITLPTTLRSIQKQTWRNVEILVVDDASNDRTAEVAAGFAATDPRIRLITLRENGGAYVARNRGLDEARGEFVATHDADDWSHPDKLRIQAEHLISNPDLVACASQQARTTSEMIFDRPDNEGHLVALNASSLMFRRDVFRSKCGSWDPVRFAADSEIFERLARATRPAAISRMSTGPLSFQRSRATSIVNDSRWGFDGYQFGARDVYMETYRSHHRNGGELVYSSEPARRFFPVPQALQPATRSDAAKRTFDTILVADLRDNNAGSRACAADWQRLKNSGRSCGIVHLYADRDVPTGEFLSPFSGLSDYCDLEILVYGEDAECETVVFHDANVLQQTQRFWPQITAKQARLVAHEPVSRESLTRAAAAVKEALTLPLELIPATAAIRQLLPDPRSDEGVTLCAENWTAPATPGLSAPVAPTQRLRKNVLFLLPVRGGNGGANSVIQEAAAMRKLGIEARVAVNRKDLGEYLHLYADVPGLSDMLVPLDLTGPAAVDPVADVVVATLFSSVSRLAAIRRENPDVLPAYYIQDYEPWFHEPGSDKHRRALASYTEVPGLLCLAKTTWLCEHVRALHGTDVRKVQPSIDHSIFRPAVKPVDGRLHVVAMVRPSTPRRGAARTMRVLRQLHEGLGDSVQLHLFGCVETDPDFLRLERGFPHTNHGPLTRQKVAELLGACHVFLDASDYQAFGRTALEAMACRCASVVPAAGGAREYAVHEENALVVDTTSEEEILRQMTTLLQSRATIDTLAEAGQKTASRYSTEESAISIAKTLGLLA